MKIDRSTYVISVLDKGRRDGELIEQAMQRLFVPIPLAGGVVTRNSLIGRVISFITFPTASKNSLDSVYSAVEKAFKQVSEDCSFSGQTRCDLQRLFPAAATTGLQRLEEIDKLVEENNRSREVAFGASVQHSYLSETPFVKDILPETFRAIFSSKREITPDITRYLEQFFRRSQDFCHPTQFDERLANLCTDYDDPKMLAASVASGGGMYRGRFGANPGVAESFAILLKSMPDSYRDNLPDYVKNFDTAALIQSAGGKLGNYLEEMLGMSPIMRSVLEKVLWDGLYYSENRKLCKEQPSLPAFLATHIDEWMQQGILGATMEFFPDGPIREMLLWASVHGKEIQTKDGRKKFIKFWENKIEDWLKKNQSQIIEPIDIMTDSVAKKIGSHLPQRLKDFLGLDKLFVHGQIWITWSRQVNGEFTVEVHASGSALRFFPKKKGKTLYPIRLENVAKEKLSESFFSRMLELDRGKVDIERQQAFFDGLIGSLGGTFVPGKECEIDPNDDELLEFAAKWLCHDYVQPKKVLFEIQRDALVSFAKNNKTPQMKGELVLAAKKLVALAKEVGKKELQRAEHTLKELQLIGDPPPAEPKLFRGEKSCLPPEIAQALADWIEIAGITNAQLAVVQELFTWAFGKEVGDLFEGFEGVGKGKGAGRQSLGSLQSNPSPRGKLGSFFYSVYFTLALTVLSWMFWLHNITKNLTLPGVFSTARPYIWNGAKQIVPQEVSEWILRTETHLFLLATRMFWQILLRAVFSKENADNLQAIADNMKEHGREVATLLRDDRVVGVEPDPGVALPASGFEVISLIPEYVELKEDRIASLQIPFLHKSDSSLPLEQSLSMLVANCMLGAPEWKATAQMEILELPMPLSPQGLEWDCIQFPVQCMERLNQLSRYVDLIPRYRILAICDYLARKDPACKLEGFSVNATPILTEQLDAKFMDPYMVEKYQEVCKYFWPDYDFDEPPGLDQIQELKDNSLFWSRIGTCPEGKLSDPSFTTAMKKYFQLWYKEKDFQDKLKTLNFPRELHFAELEDLFLQDLHPQMRRLQIVPERMALLMECSLIAGDRKIDMVKFSYLESGIFYRLGQHCEDLTYKVGNNLKDLSSFLERSARNSFGINDIPDQGRILSEKNRMSKAMTEMRFVAPSGELLRELERTLRERTVKDLNIFHLDRLKQQLCTSPQTAIAIIESFEKVFNFFENKNEQMEVFYYASLCQQYVTVYAPDYAEEFKKRLDRLSGKFLPDEARMLECFRYSTYTKGASQEEGALALIRAIFAYERLANKKYEEKILEKTVFWQQIIGKLLQDWDFRTRAAKMICTDVGVAYNEDSFPSAIYSCMVLWMNEMRKHLYTVSPDFDPVIAHFPEKGMYRDSQNRWLSEDLSFSVSKVECGKFAMFRIEDGIIYSKYGKQLWVECASEDKEEPIHVIQNEKKFLAPYDRKSNILILEVETSENVVSTKLFSRGLAPLARFSPLENFVCYVKDGALSRLEHTGYGLTFQNQSGKLVLQTGPLKGFWIVERQSHKNLSHLSSYLLLENGREKKVIVPDGDWCGAAILRAFPWAGFLLPKFSNKLPRSNEMVSYICSISSDGNLTTEDPKGLAYLLLLALIEGNFSRSDRLFESLERICRREEVSQSLQVRLLLLYLFPAAKRYQKTLMPLLEQNRQVHKKKNPNGEKLDGDNELERYILLASLYRELLEEELAPDQQWFLFEALKRNARPSLPFLVRKSLGSEAAFETLLLSPALQSRYQALKENYGFTVSGLSSAVSFAKKVACAPAIGNAKPTLLRKNLDLQDLRPPTIEAEVSIAKKTKEWMAYSNVIERITVNLETDAAAVDFSIISKEMVEKRFLSLYAIAKEIEPGKEALQRVLQLQRGGWDEASGYLLKVLEAVAAYPCLYPALPLNNEDYLKNAYYWLHDIFTRYSAIELMAASSRVGIDLIESSPEMGLERAGQAFPLLKSAMEMLSSRSIVWGSKTYNALVQTDEASISRLSSPARKHRSLALLASEDTLFDTILDILTKHAFEKGGTADPQDSVSLLHHSSDSPSEIERTERVNKGIADFYARPQNNDYFKLKSPKVLWQVYVELFEWTKAVRESWEKEQARLEKFGTFSDLTRNFAKNHFPQEGTAQEIELLESAVGKQMMRKTRIAQMERILSLLEEAIQKDCAPEPLEKVTAALVERRSWRVDELSPRLCRLYLAFETAKETLLWPKQIEAINELLADKGKDSVIELLMSFGKTFFGIPTTDAYLADGKTLVVNIWPQAMAETNIREIGLHSFQAFGQKVNALRIQRTHPPSLAQWRGIFVMVKSCQENKETINMTKQDAQGLELLFIEQLKKCRKFPTFKNLEIARIQKNILHLFRYEAHMVGDEAHELFNEREELNFPLGEPVGVADDVYNVMEAVVEALYTFPDLIALIQNGESGKIPTGKFALIAKKVFENPLFKDVPEESFLCFVLGKAEKFPHELENLACFGAISLVKGILSNLLPMALSKTISVDFGRSAIKDVAIPYNGNESPMESAVIKHPFEALEKTFVMFIHHGLSFNQFECLITSLLKDATAEKNATGRSLQESRSARFVEMNMPPFQLGDLQNQAKEAYALYRNDKECLLYLLREHVKEQVSYFEESLTSTSQNFASMFAKKSFDTGTPFNDGTYAEGLEMLWDKGTLGEALHILTNKCSAIHEIQSRSPSEILDESLKSFFTGDSKFSALIDGGARLRGLDNKQVAGRMLAFAAEQRPDIKAIDFFYRDETGKELLMSWQAGMEEPMPYDLCFIPVTQRLAYFDQRHGFAANIVQRPDGKGLVLLGPEHTLNRLLQEIFRMRGIKVFNKVVVDGDKGGQKVEFALTSEVREKISGTALPTLEQIIQFVVNNEAALVADKNFRSYRDKAENIVRRALLDKILKCQTIDEAIRLQERLDAILTFKTEVDPVRLFGYVEKQKVMEDVLAMIRAKVLDSIAGSPDFPADEVALISKRLEGLPRPPMKITATVREGGNRLSDLSNDPFEKQLQQELQNEQELQQEQQACTAPGHAAPKYVEIPWPVIEMPRSLTWMSGLSVPLYEAGKAAEKAGGKLRCLASHLDNRFLMTNNFLPMKSGAISRSVYLGDFGQKPLFEALVHVEEVEGKLAIRSFVAVSQKEAEYWRKLLKKKCEGPMKAFLWNISSQTIAAGDQLPLKLLRENADLRRLEVQAKFLNGDTIYHKTQLPHLKDWVERVGLESACKAFKAIYAKREVSPYLGSDIHHVFKRQPASSNIASSRA